MSSSDENKANAMAFYDLMFNQCRPREAIERYARAYYRQHNPHVGDGKDAFVEYFERMAAAWPGKRAIAKDNYVVLHCLQDLARRSRLRRYRHLPVRLGLAAAEVLRHDHG
jgi:predicted SnoaL-like aldol condensation-catalyzing enzyme